MKPRCLFLFVRSCLWVLLLSASPHGLRLGVSLRLVSRLPVISFTITSTGPCRAHDRGRPRPQPACRNTGAFLRTVISNYASAIPMLQSHCYGVTLGALHTTQTSIAVITENAEHQVFLSASAAGVSTALDASGSMPMPRSTHSTPNPATSGHQCSSTTAANAAIM